MSRRAILAPAACLPFVTACSGVQSALDPAADQARHIQDVLNLMLIVCGLMFLLVLGFLAWALWRGRRSLAADVFAPPEPDVQDPGLQRATAIWAGVILVGIAVLTTTSFVVDRGLAEYTARPLSIKITAKQWWWDVQYQDDADPPQTVRTANELHLPQNRSAIITLQAQDVIHSFWVPNLHGKEDLIPGRTNRIILTPRRLGQFRGQCAEFCGLQHAHMALDVTIQTPAAFEAWRRAQLADARPPATPEQVSGRQVFLSKPCVMCHQIQGTTAGSLAGPDLTHVASRKTIAAGALPNNRAALQGWIADPQGVKPGSNMPVVDLSPQELNAVAAYLDSLK